MRLLLSWGLLLLLGFAAGCDRNGSLGSPHTDSTAAKAKAEWEAKQAEEQRAELARCTNEKQAVLAGFEAEMQAKAYAKARLAVYRCSQRTSDPDYSAKVALAETKLDEQEVAALVKQLTARNAPVSVTVPVYERLLQYKGKPAFRLAEPHVKRYAKSYEDHKRWKKEFEQDDVRPQVGWTQDQLVARKGYPRRTNRTVTASGAREQWIYCLFEDSKCTYVYLTDGVVTGYQD